MATACRLDVKRSIRATEFMVTYVRANTIVIIVVFVLVLVIVEVAVVVNGMILYLL